MTTHHVCFSGSLACSGCNPCEACAVHVRRCVLPVAMIAAGFNQSEQQSEAFFQGYLYGWKRLHEAMERDPILQQQFKAVDITQLMQPPPQVQLPLPMQPMQAPIPDPWQQATWQQTPTLLSNPWPQQVPFPQQFVPQMPMEDVRAEVPQETSSLVDQVDIIKPIDLQTMKELLTEAESKQDRRVKNLTKPMDPEEIAAAATPIVLGSVMDKR